MKTCRTRHPAPGTPIDAGLQTGDTLLVRGAKGPDGTPTAVDHRHAKAVQGFSTSQTGPAGGGSRFGPAPSGAGGATGG